MLSLKEIHVVCREIADALRVSEGEFWLCYGNPFLFQCQSIKTHKSVKGEYSQQDICELWCLPKQTVNTIVSNLIKKGYISLEVVPGTRNRKIIRISEEGRKYGEGIVMPVFQKEKNSLKKLSSEEIQLYIDILGKYIHFLKSELEE